ncbi:winged helix-turn-helix transcriptional regulator [Spirosoma litoris]
MEVQEAINFQEKIKWVQDTMFVLGGKWKLAIIIAMYHGNKRFNDISISIPNITNRVLSKELKHLEENLLIKRAIVSDYPIKVEYRLTEYCYTISEVLIAMETWGKQHREKIKRS